MPNSTTSDVTFVGARKLSGGEAESFGEIIPDLTVEVLSPHDRMTEVGRKIGEYFENGVPLVWLVDPRAQTVTVFRSLTDTERLTVEAALTAEPVLPGFSVPVRLFFE